MNRLGAKICIYGGFFVCLLGFGSSVLFGEDNLGLSSEEREVLSPESKELQEAFQSQKEAGSMTEKGASSQETKSAVTPKRATAATRAEGFVASPDWEFDGFVAGGLDQDVKSMFVTNDLLYLNVGLEEGYRTGDPVFFYRRGNKVRDPQTGRFLGYEVRKIAKGVVTDKIEDDTCSVRIVSSFEPVEIGDLVKKE